MARNLYLLLLDSNIQTHKHTHRISIHCLSVAIDRSWIFFVYDPKLAIINILPGCGWFRESSSDDWAATNKATDRNELKKMLQVLFAVAVNNTLSKPKPHQEKEKTSIKIYSRNYCCKTCLPVRVPPCQCFRTTWWAVVQVSVKVLESWTAEYFNRIWWSTIIKTDLNILSS